MSGDEKTTLEAAKDKDKDKAIQQFVRRRRYAQHIEKIDNAGLHAGSPMYFYCRECGVPTEVLPEDYLFPPPKECSQCQGLKREGWFEAAKQAAEGELGGS
jgi:hypothetical protein